MNTTTANPAADNDAQPDRDPQSEEAQRDQAQRDQAQHDEAPMRDRALRRPVEDRMLAGVAAGIARYLGVDVTFVRIAIAVLTVAGGAGLPLYLAGWLLIPEEGATQSLAEDFIQNWQSRSHSL
jgi:phage shock protein PspC (stress-responsive transcriptional regulator)